MLSLRIAWRFLRSAPVQTLLIAGGIAVGISAQIFVGSLIQSLQANLVDQTIGSAPQVTIEAIDDGDPVTFSPRMQDIVYKDPRVKQGTVVPTRALTSLFTDGSDSAPLNLIGGRLNELDGIYKISERTIEGKASLRSTDIIIGKDFAEKFSISPGDSIKLALQGGSPAQFTVVGIFDLGAAAFNERTAFVSGEVPRSTLGWSASEYSQIQVQMTEPFQSAEVAADWRSKLPGVSVVDWQAQNADLLVALQSQGSSSLLIQTFVLVAVALGIASTLAISAVQKTRQIGILKAMGMKDGASGRIFLFEALIVGGLGSISGLALGWFFVWSFNFVPTPFDTTIRLSFALTSAGVGILVALASSIVPIRRTSKLDPIEVIQNG